MSSPFELLKGQPCPFHLNVIGGHRKVIKRSFVKDLSKCVGYREFPIFTMIVSLEIAKYSLSEESTFGILQMYPYCLSFMTQFHFEGHSLLGFKISEICTIGQIHSQFTSKGHLKVKDIS